jgi:tetratricopeptide (TPR) repeat protein
MSDRRKHLEFLRKTAKDALWAGDYERALTLYDDGLALARAWRDRDLEDLFTCNRATTLLEMDRNDFDLSRLKEILLRNPSSRNGALAAHTCARAHELRGEIPRARFYAQTALEKSRELGLQDVIASSFNMLGNMELRESRFEVARELYQEALEQLQTRGDTDSCLAAQYSDNLGYCYIALDEVDKGMPLVCRAVELFEKFGATQALDYPCLDLCFANVKLEKLSVAEGWGLRALKLGEQFSRTDVVKNSHYLLAETYSEMGQPEQADEHYEALSTYYPDFPALKSYLQQISLMEVINLRA